MSIYALPIVNWKAAKMSLPVAPYPGLYVMAEDGKWRVTEAKRGVPRVDASVRTTATDAAAGQEIR